MKTSAIAILAVAATAFAQTNVLVGTEADFIGPTDNFQVTLGQCCKSRLYMHIIIFQTLTMLLVDLPQRYHLALTSIAPNEGFQCDAFRYVCYPSWEYSRERTISDDVFI